MGECIESWYISINNQEIRSVNQCFGSFSWGFGTWSNRGVVWLVFIPKGAEIDSKWLFLPIDIH